MITIHRRALVCLLALGLLGAAAHADKRPPIMPVRAGSGELRPATFTVSQRGGEIEIAVDVGEVALREGRLECAGSIPYRVAGRPVLPTIVRDVVVPDDRQVRGLLVSGIQSRLVDYRPPVQGLVVNTPFGLQRRPTPPGPSGVFPVEPVTLVEGEPLQDHPYRLYYLVIHPARWDPAANATRIAQRLRIRLELAPAVRPDRPAAAMPAWAEARFGRLVRGWQRGVRRPGGAGLDGIAAPAALGAAVVPAAVDWSSGRPQFRYRVALYDEPAAGGPPAEAAERLAKLGARLPAQVATKAQARELAAADWQSSPGIVVAGPAMAHEVSAVAAFLGWPLCVVEDQADAAAARTLAGRLQARLVIAAGCPGMAATVRVNSAEEANGLLLAVQKEMGYETPSPETGIVSQALAAPAAVEPLPKPVTNYLVLYDNTSPSLAAAVEVLRAYRSAVAVDVNGTTPAKTLLATVASYAPRYLALVGDGDYGNVDQFFAPDPTPEGDDPTLVPTDFLYEERSSVSFADADNNGVVESVTWPTATVPRAWEPETHVGRLPLGAADLTTYVQMLSNYENRLLSYDHVKKGAFFSYFCQTDGAATWDVHDRYQTPGLTAMTHHPIYHDATCPSDGTFSSTNVFAEMSSFDNLYYFNTHGACDALVVSMTNQALASSGVTSHSFASHPAFVWLDACLTGALGNKVNSGTTLLFYSISGHDIETSATTCFGAQWLRAGALGSMGASMLSYLGYADSFDRALALEMVSSPGRSLAADIGYARARYYASQGTGDSYVRKTVLEMQYFGDPQVCLLWDTALLPGPSNLAATPVSGSEVELTWTDNSAGESGFRIERQTGTSTWAEIATVGPDVSAYRSAGLTPGTTYSYRVRAYQDATVSTYSNTAVVTPYDWQSENVSWQVTYLENWAKSGWVTKPGALCVRVYFSAVNVESGYDHLTTNAGDDFSGAYTGVTSGVKAGSTIGLTLTSDYSFNGYFTISRVEWQGPATSPAACGGDLFANVASPPLPPTSLKATATSTTQASLTWTDNSANESGFKVYRRLSTGSWPATPTLTLGPNTTSTSLGGHTPGLTYEYRVAAYNAVGSSGYAETSLTLPPEGEWQSEPVNWRVDYGNTWDRTGWVTKPGAAFVRLHFSELVTEAGFDTLSTDAADSWSGSFTNVTSNVRAGNTINLRLVSDLTNTYHFIIDRVEWQGTATGPATKGGDLFKVATFEDVPITSGYWSYVEAIYREGITSGCSQTPRLYCPESSITRGQMAVFLCRAAGWTPYNKPTPTFADVPPTAGYYGYVEEVYRRNVTVGCVTTPPLRYCPDSPVTRGQMAVFLCRAAGVPTYNNPTPTFADVPATAGQYIYVEGMYKAAITVGCVVTPPRQYCPNSPVTRGQMAVFLCRAFGINTE